MLSQAGLDGPEARQPWRLVQRREPPGSEIDRVQLQPIRRALLEHSIARRPRRRDLLWRKRCGIAPDRFLDDSHVFGVSGDTRARRANLIDDTHESPYFTTGGKRGLRLVQHDSGRLL